VGSWGGRSERGYGKGREESGQVGRVWRRKVEVV